MQLSQKNEYASKNPKNDWDLVIMIPKCPAIFEPRLEEPARSEYIMASNLLGHKWDSKITPVN